MKKLINNLTIVLVLVFLTGCMVKPQEIGMSPEQWNGYSKSKQELLSDRYYEAKAARKKLIKQSIDSAEKQTLLVNVQGGRIMMPPFRRSYTYQPITFSIKSNECKDVEFNQIEGRKNISIEVCYLQKTLYLDPNFMDKSKALGSIRLMYMPLWARGFTYSAISSTGYARFSNVDIHVQTQ